MSRDAVRCPLRKRSLEEWLINIIVSMLRNTESSVRANGTMIFFINDFLVHIGLHQASMLNPLLFTIVLEVLSREIRSGCPEKLLYADDLALVRETHGCLKGRLGAKLMMNSENPRKDAVESKFSCTVCRKE